MIPMPTMSWNLNFIHAGNSTLTMIALLVRKGGHEFLTHLSVECKKKILHQRTAVGRGEWMQKVMCVSVTCSSQWINRPYSCQKYKLPRLIQHKTKYLPKYPASFSCFRKMQVISYCCWKSRYHHDWLMTAIYMINIHFTCVDVTTMVCHCK